MGQTLSEPVTAKETSSCGNSFVKVGSSCMQGWRINMEDAHTHLLAVPEDKDACFFAVFDGHGGAKVAQYAGNHLHKKIVQSESYAQGKIEDAIREGFLRLDEDMIKDEQMKDEMAGTTAVIVLIKNGKIFCGNVGDSRAIASVGGLAEALSYDHKPANELEAKRIIAAGGWVEFNRVNGNLALSRALGDFIFKRNEEKPPEEQIVTAFPDVIVRNLSSDWEFILLACDGIWDVMSNQEVVDFCRERLAAGLEPELVCEELLTRCLAPDCQMGGLGCDNMTVVLACMLQNRPWEELKRKCSRPRPPTPNAAADDVIPTTAVTPPPTPYSRRGVNNMATDDDDNDTSSKQDESSVGRVAPFLMHERTIGGAAGAGGDVDVLGGSPPTDDQTVPEVVRESSSDSEPSQRPAKQGKMDEKNNLCCDVPPSAAAAAGATASNDDVNNSTTPLLGNNAGGIVGVHVGDGSTTTTATTSSSTTSATATPTVNENSAPPSAPCVPNVESPMDTTTASTNKTDSGVLDSNVTSASSVAAAAATTTNPEQQRQKHT